jgi:hypothetical protein
MQRFYRQGDVLFRRGDVVPEGLEHVASKAASFVVARGEATGHHHAIRPKAKRCRIDVWRGSDSMLFVRVSGGSAILEHQEHGPIVVAPGIYKAGVAEREFDYAEDSMRRVVD